MKKRAFLVLGSLAFLLLLLVLPFSVFLNREVAYYAYKEVIYRTVVNNASAGQKDPQKICLSLQDYLYTNIFVPQGARVVDKDLYNDLIRGIGWCDQRSWALGTLVGKKGIDNRMLMTEGESSHSFLEANIYGKWRMLDPFYGLAFFDQNGELVSFEDLCSRPSLFYDSSKMRALKAVDNESYAKVKDYFTQKIFFPNPQPPEIRGNPIKKKDRLRFCVSGILDFYQGLFGGLFASAFQDLYLNYSSDTAGSSRLYFRARNYDVANRYQLALMQYKRFIKDFPGDQDAENARFFLGALYQKMGNPDESISALEELIKKFPQTKWMPYADTLLGHAYEISGKQDLAKEYYRKSIEWRKARLEHVEILQTDAYIRLFNLTHKNTGGGK